MVSKFQAGDLVRFKMGQDTPKFWKSKIGLIIKVIYEHGDPSFLVLWNGRKRPRFYNKNQLKHCVHA